MSIYVPPPTVDYIYWKDDEDHRMKRHAPMTNYYHTNYSDAPSEMSWRRALEQLRYALAVADWSPLKWATQHDRCFDLVTAWHLASLVLNSEECGDDD